MPDRGSARRKGSEGVEPHPLVDALAGDPSAPPQKTVKLFGFPGRSAEADTTRLWLDLDLNEFVDVPNDAIRYSKTLPDDEGTMLWVDAGASLRHGAAQSRDVQAEFLGGEITGEHLGGAAGAAGGFGGPQAYGWPTTYPGCPPPPTFFRCPTLDCPPSYHYICPSYRYSCPSRFTCPSYRYICPSTKILCRPSILQLTCASWTLRCQPSLTLSQCPTKLCPSVTIPCESIPACPSAICPESLACGGPITEEGFFG